MSKMTAADREERLARFRLLLSEVEGLRERGQLTRSIFERYWRDAQKMLGEGQEAEAIESLGFLALEDDWLPGPLNDLFADD